MYTQSDFNFVNIFIFECSVDRLKSTEPDRLLPEGILN